MQNFDPARAFQSLTQKRNGSKTDHQVLIEKIDEVLFYLNMVKNSATVNVGPHEALTRIYTGQLMYVDTRDNAMSPHLMMSGMWEENVSKAFRAILKKDDVVMDIGANFGYFGMIAGADVGSKGCVVFVEANPYLIPYIEKSATVNGLVRFSDVVHAAISDQEGTAQFSLLKDNWVSSGLVDVKELSRTDGIKYTVEEKIEVKTTTVDSLRKKLDLGAVNVIKMDIEGFEHKAFAGMTETIKHSPDLKLLLEFTPNRYEKPQKFYDELSDAFAWLYVIEKSGTLKRVDSYTELQDCLRDDWAMVVASKDALGN